MSWIQKAVPLLEANELAKENKAVHDRLEKKRTSTETQFKAARDDLDRAFLFAFDSFLGPFADTFSKLKNVDLDELPILDAVPELASLNLEMRKVSLDAVKGLASLAGGTAAGATAGALTFSAVGLFAAASTGTAIGSLSGAAATSATLAWLGGGSLAAGGGGVAAGTTVLAGIVAAPVLLAAGGFLYWQGKKSLQTQKELSLELKKAEAKLARDCTRVLGATARHRDTAQVVRDLADVGVARLPAFEALLEASDDFSAYSPQSRGQIAELAGLAQTVAAVLACPILDEKGNVTPLSDDALAAARGVVGNHAA
ncbi:MAG: hypothetical protein OSB43_10220 [Nocardioides sp.]|uniref:hypothetical protein n=1 Tax=Nocardioides sp. TaxID=35761 RepID=UPI00239D8135|nr:hypothetical protein [Nocardioides sp.]MDE0776636.1 hypothetical protein [Nocardioides sp.]